MDKVSTTEPAGATEVEPQRSLIELIKRLLRVTELMILVAVIALVIVGAVANPNFLHIENLNGKTQ